MERNITIKDKCNNDCILNADGVLINREEPKLGYWDDEYNYVKRTECGRDYYINGMGEKKLG